jgi:hypothetical protein
MNLSSRVRQASSRARGQVVITRTASGTSVAAFNKHVITEPGATSDVVISSDGQMTVWTQPGADRDGTDPGDRKSDQPETDYEAG